MLAIVLALASSLGYGCADYAGGLASRDVPVLRVTLISIPVGLSLLVVLLPVLPAYWSVPAVVWGGLSGVFSAGAFALVYASLAAGPMSILSPLTAVISAAVPVAAGVGLEGEQLTGTAAAGIGLALIAVVAISAAGGTGGARPAPRPLAMAAAAGASIGLQFIYLQRSPVDSGIAPAIAGRVVAGLILAAAFALARPAVSTAGASRPAVLIAAASGVLDTFANLAVLLAVRHGSLAVVAVIVALYPGSTVLLARLTLGERLSRSQAAGLGGAAAAVVLLALAS
jgi:drug/metabolite transporter (DMT)-like permease